jgi:hypothetical protein
MVGRENTCAHHPSTCGKGTTSSPYLGSHESQGRLMGVQLPRLYTYDGTFTPGKRAGINTQPTVQNKNQREKHSSTHHCHSLNTISLLVPPGTTASNWL